MWFTDSKEDDIPSYPVPRDDDPSYVKAFLPSQIQEYQKFFQDFGFVVIKNVLTSDECQRSIDEIWEYIEKGEFQKEVDSIDLTSFPNRKDSSTWETNWPPMAQQGFVGLHPIFKRQLVMNRQNPLIYSVFSNLMNKKELIVNQDRVGLFRPTLLKTISNGKEIVTQKETWQTNKNLHFDVNPWRYFSGENDLTESEERINRQLSELKYNKSADFIFENNEIGRAHTKQIQLQAVLNLYPNKEEDGGFQLVPGFSKHAQEWVENTREKNGKRWPTDHTFILLPEKCSLHQRAIRITMAPGSLVVWDQTVAHGSIPNNSSNPRICQFIKMHIADQFYESRSGTQKVEFNQRGVNRAQTIREEMKKNEIQETELSHLGQKLFGFEVW